MSLLRMLALAVLFVPMISGCVDVSASDDAGRKIDITLTAMEEGSGYSFEHRELGLRGTLTRKEDSKEPWKLEGSITFPSSGYSLKGPEITIAESYPEQVSIKMTVLPPPRGMIVLPALHHQSFKADIAVSDEAAFSMVVYDTRLHWPGGNDKKSGSRPFPPHRPSHTRPDPPPIPLQDHKAE